MMCALPRPNAHSSHAHRPRFENEIRARASVGRHRGQLFVKVLAQKLNCVEKVCVRKGLHDDDVLIYNRIVPEFERMRLNPIAATNITLIGGDKHGSQEKKGR